MNVGHDSLRTGLAEAGGPVSTRHTEIMGRHQVTSMAAGAAATTAMATATAAAMVAEEEATNTTGAGGGAPTQDPPADTRPATPLETPQGLATAPECPPSIASAIQLVALKQPC